MGVQCECGKTVEGAVSRSEVASQVKSKVDAALGPVRTELELTKTALTTAKTQASNYAAVVAERDTLKAAAESRVQQDARTTAMTEANVGGPVTLEHLEMLHKSATAGQDDPKDFGEWLKTDGVKHPLVAPHIGAERQAADAGAGAGDANSSNGADAADGAGTGVNGNPNTNDGAQGAGANGGRATPEQLRSYFSSPAFTSLSPEERRAALAEKRAAHAPQA